MLDKSIKNILIGVLLGDSHIGTTGSDKAFISFEQSKIKFEYLNYLHKLVKEAGFVLEEPRNYTRTDSRHSNKINESLYFRTKSLVELRALADMFLDSNGKKIIPHNIAEHLTLQGLAFLICDDGMRVKRGGVTLCTDSFSSEEVNLLREALKNNFNVNTSIHKKRGVNNAIYERIYINKSSLDEIKPLLKEHMHDSMLYKINEIPDVE